MEDLRIQKTRKALKQALINLLDQKSFEKISVTDICKESNISRITFYTHYDHKYDLALEIFNDFATLGKAMFQTKMNNHSNLNVNTDIQNFINFVDVVYELTTSNKDFFKHINQEENPYLLSVQNGILLDTVEAFTKQATKKMHLKYSSRQITGFIIYGLSGFISETKEEEKPNSREDIKRLMSDILKNSIFYE